MVKLLTVLSYLFCMEQIKGSTSKGGALNKNIATT